jgi:hypothetical protein
MCKICNKVLPVKLSSIKKHLESVNHVNNVAKLEKKKTTLLSYSKVIIERDRVTPSAGSTLPTSVMGYRMKVAHALVKGGCGFAVLNPGSELREIIEDQHFTVPKDSCASLIPSINELERQRTIDELKEAVSYSICSDGTINVAECLVMVSFSCLLSLLANLALVFQI